MTKEELCIHACKYAIGELVRKGSSAFITSAHEGRQQISWIEVVEWLNILEQEPETVTEFADRCRECGAKYGKLLGDMVKKEG